MSATSFSSLYGVVRVLTGNDDPTVGELVLPDARIDTLLKTAILTIRSYAQGLPEFVTTTDPTTGVLGVAVAGSENEPVSNQHMLNALCYVVAHKYYVGIGNKSAASEALAGVNSEAELVVGTPITEVNEYRLQNYTTVINTEMMSKMMTF